MDNDMKKVFEQCVKRWEKYGMDDRIEDAINVFNTKWLNDEKIIEQKEIVLKLLKKFDYYSREEIHIAIEELNEKLIEKFGVSDEDSIISIVKKKDGKYNSSVEYITEYRNLRSLNKNIFYTTLDELKIEWWKNIKKVVFVDDCSGTGTQFTDFLDRERKRRSYANKKIILAVAIVIDSAVKHIKEYAKDNSLDIEIIWYCSKEKAYQSISAEEKEKIYELSKKRKINEKYIHGFKNAEALIAFFSNTPNDKIGIFWEKTEKNDPIFLRELDRKPGWQTNSMNKRKRKRRQYESKCRR